MERQTTLPWAPNWSFRKTLGIIGRRFLEYSLQLQSKDLLFRQQLSCDDHLKET